MAREGSIRLKQVALDVAARAGTRPFCPARPHLLVGLNVHLPRRADASCVAAKYQGCGMMTEAEAPVTLATYIYTDAKFK